MRSCKMKGAFPPPLQILSRAPERLRRMDFPFISIKTLPESDFSGSACSGMLIQLTGTVAAASAFAASLRAVGKKTNSSVMMESVQPTGQTRYKKVRLGISGKMR